MIGNQESPEPANQKPNSNARQRRGEQPSPPALRVVPPPEPPQVNPEVARALLHLLTKAGRRNGDHHHPEAP